MLKPPLQPCGATTPAAKEKKGLSLGFRALAPKWWSAPQNTTTSELPLQNFGAPAPGLEQSTATSKLPLQKFGAPLGEPERPLWTWSGSFEQNSEKKITNRIQSARSMSRTGALIDFLEKRGAPNSFSLILSLTHPIYKLSNPHSLLKPPSFHPKLPQITTFTYQNNSKNPQKLTLLSLLLTISPPNYILSTNSRFLLGPLWVSLRFVLHCAKREEFGFNLW